MRAEFVDFYVLDQVQYVPCVRFESELRLVFNIFPELWTDRQFSLLSALNPHLYVATEHINLFRVDHLLRSVIVKTSSRARLLISWVKRVNY